MSLLEEAEHGLTWSFSRIPRGQLQSKKDFLFRKIHWFQQRVGILISDDPLSTLFESFTISSKLKQCTFNSRRQVGLPSQPCHRHMQLYTEYFDHTESLAESRRYLSMTKEEWRLQIKFVSPSPSALSLDGDHRHDTSINAQPHPRAKEL